MNVNLIRLMRRTSPVLRGTESPAIKAIVDRRYHFQEDNDVRHFYLAISCCGIEFHIACCRYKTNLRNNMLLFLRNFVSVELELNRCYLIGFANKKISVSHTKNVCL